MNTKNILIGIAGLAAIILFGGTASAQYRGSWGGHYDQEVNPSATWFDDYYDDGRFESRHDDRFNRRYQGEIYGRVLGLKTVIVRRTGERHLVALINTYTPGLNLIVDLGPQWRARQLGLRPYGDRLWVTGEVVRVNGKPVVLARSARTEYRRLAIDGRDRRFYRSQRPVIRDHRSRGQRYYGDGY